MSQTVLRTKSSFSFWKELAEPRGSAQVLLRVPALWLSCADAPCPPRRWPQHCLCQARPAGGRRVQRVTGGRKGHCGAGHLGVWKEAPATMKRSTQNRKPWLNQENSEDIRRSLGGWGGGRLKN